MKKITFSILAVFFLAAPVFAVNFSSPKEKASIAAPETSLRLGERLEYNLEWIGIAVGKITLQVSGAMEKLDGRDCYHIIARAIPNSFFRRLYDIEYTVHTYIEAEGFRTLRFEKIRRIRNKTGRALAEFDYKNKEIRYTTEGTGDSIIMSPERGKMKREIPNASTIISGDIQDLFSSFYYFRLLRLEPGKNYTINIYYDRRVWPEIARIGQPSSKEIRKKGVFAVFRATMVSALNKYILGDPELIVYFTADSRRIPLEFKLGTGLGAIRGKLKSIPD